MGFFRYCLIGSSKNGWGGWIRTNECKDQNLVPYHLATPQILYLIVNPARELTEACNEPLIDYA